MDTVNTFTAYLTQCNLHFCFYAALAAPLLHRGVMALRERQYDEMREHLVHGALYLCLGLL